MIRRNYLKSLMIFILMCLPLLGASAQQKVTVNVVNASLKQVFSTIENQTSYRFSYKSDIIDHRKDITIRKSGVPVTTVLDAALKGRNLKYSVVSQKSIVVSEKHANVTAPQQNNKHKMYISLRIDIFWKAQHGMKAMKLLTKCMFVLCKMLPIAKMLELLYMMKIQRA